MQALLVLLSEDGTMKRICMTLVAGFAFVGMTGTANAGCVQAGGEATMVTQDLAKFMANAALNNSIKANGWTAQGSVKMTCDTNMGLPHCVAKQKACS
jgi:putative hemolysin